MASEEPKRGILLPIAVTVVGLAAIGVIEDLPARHSIEHKLTANSTDALRHAGVPFSNVRFVGRDGTVTVSSTDAGNQALAVVRHVDGVRVVDVVVLGQFGGGTPVTASPTPSVSLTAVPSSGASPAGSAAPSTSTAPSTGTAPSTSAGPSTSSGATAAPSTSASGAASPSAGATPTPTPSPTQSAASVQKQLNALGKITFTSGSSTLTSRDKGIVKKVAAILEANPDVDISVQGDTDSAGPAAFNLTMSRLRAHSVANGLHALGIAKNRMTVVGYGETRPLVPNDTAHHRGINRRVDILAREH